MAKASKEDAEGNLQISNFISHRISEEFRKDGILTKSF